MNKIEFETDSKNLKIKVSKTNPLQKIIREELFKNKKRYVDKRLKEINKILKG